MLGESRECQGAALLISLLNSPSGNLCLGLPEKLNLSAPAGVWKTGSRHAPYCTTVFSVPLEAEIR